MLTAERFSSDVSVISALTALRFPHQANKGLTSRYGVDDREQEEWPAFSL